MQDKRAIKTKYDLEQAEERIWVLWEAPEGSYEAEERDILEVLVSDYYRRNREEEEDERNPIDPIAVIRYEMDKALCQAFDISADRLIG